MALRNEWTEVLSSDTRFEERLNVGSIRDSFPVVPDFVPSSRLGDWKRGVEEALSGVGWSETQINQFVQPL